ncbi:hypothetical protein, partial [Paenibacillus thiaminolyticus]|uniref:hypothetical protein n=1 Tax=Paenibacillus thiaminolyticus TaxID=49283 RepID=UPI002280B47F
TFSTACYSQEWCAFLLEMKLRNGQQAKTSPPDMTFQRQAKRVKPLCYILREFFFHYIGQA